jgi:hypothetical protein
MWLTRFIPVPGSFAQGPLGSSQVPSEPHGAFALFLDPGWTSAPSHYGAPVLPPLFHSLDTRGNSMQLAFSGAW